MLGIAPRGGDEKLELGIKVVVGNGLDGGHELVARLPVELTDEQHNRVVVGVVERNAGHEASS